RSKAERDQDRKHDGRTGDLWDVTHGKPRGVSQTSRNSLAKLAERAWHAIWSSTGARLLSR
ncbi:MAG: hypothetical protein ACI80K_004369, partial [Paracoccaceae bacterium]